MAGWRESKGSKLLLEYVQELLPNQKIETEYSLGERLALDIYCDAYKIGLEYHGRQHFEYVEFFHGNLQGFKDSQMRDMRKEELCRELGIVLIAFDYREELSKELVFDRVLDAIKNNDVKPPENTSQSSFKGNPYYEQQLQRQREYRRRKYREQKEWRKRRDDER